jgi:hypothetical protein
MRGDVPDAGTDREGDLDLLVDRGFVTAGAQRAMIVIRPQRFQRAVGAKHAAATWAQHVPGKVEQPKPGSVEKARNHLFFVEPGPLRKIQRVDAVELMVFASLNQVQDGIRHHGICGLLQQGEFGLDVAHVKSSNRSSKRQSDASLPARNGKHR